MGVRDIPQAWQEYAAVKWTCPSCSHTSLESPLILYEGQLPPPGSGPSTYRVRLFMRHFTAMIHCSTCEQGCVLAGTYTVERDPSSRSVRVVRLYQVHYFFPSPPLLTRWPNLPETILTALPSLEVLFWVDASACGTSLRRLVELFLTLRKVKPGPNLHARIQQYGKASPELAEHLMAIKWLGNAGSHHGKSLTRDDTLDALEQLDYVFEKTYSGREEALKKRATAINSRKGPARRK